MDEHQDEHGGLEEDRALIQAPRVPAAPRGRAIDPDDWSSYAENDPDEASELAEAPCEPSRVVAPESAAALNLCVEGRAFGPPGCGKTTYLTQTIRRMVERYGPDGLIVASFSKSAARELVGRDLPVHRDRVGTLHSLAYRAIGRPTFALKTEAVEEWNASHDAPSWRLVPMDSKSGDYADPLGGGNSGKNPMLERIGVLRARCRPMSAWPQGVEFAPTMAFHLEWEEFKRRRGLVDFADMIERAMSHAPPFDARAILCDEAQDCTTAEMRLLRAWGRGMEYLVLAGDDDQAIYDFRGADPREWLSIDVDPQHLRMLGQSFRVPIHVHGMAEWWIQQIEGIRAEKEYKPRDFEGSADAIGGYFDEYAAEIARAVAENTDRSMIVAPCAYHLGSVIKELRDRGVPYHNPYARHRGDWNPMRGGAERLGCWMDRREGWTLGAAHKALEHVAAKKVPWERGWKSKLLQFGTHETAQACQVTPHTWKAITGTDQIPPPDLDWFLGRILLSEAPKYTYAAQVCRNQGLDALTDQPRVVVGTIHSVKGGEAENVYMTDQLSPSAAAELVTAHGRDAWRRLVYVGMTRAKERLWFYRTRR